MILREIVFQMEMSIPAKFYYLMATRFLKIDIRICQKLVFWAHVFFEKVA